MTDNRICPNCGGLVRIRNPTGKCDHLYWPENVPTAKPAPMTDAEVIAELRTTSPLNNARRAFSSWRAKIEQAEQQRRPLSAIEMRRMEFEAVLKIAAALGVTPEKWSQAAQPPSRPPASKIG